MPTPTFDGDNLLIILPAGEPVIDVRTDLYSEWKLWQLLDNRKFPQAFTTEGGQPTTPIEALGRTYFLRNDKGWRIRPAEEDADIRFDGNFFPLDFTLPLFVPTLGDFTVATRLKFSNLVFLEATLPAFGPDEVYMGVAYDEDSTLVLVNFWLERRGVAVAVPVTGTIIWHNPDGTVLFSATDMTPDAQGHFQTAFSQALVSDTAYYALVTVTDGTGPVTTHRAVPTAT